MKKRVLACTLAMATVVGSSFTAFADDANLTDMAGAGTGQEITGATEMELPKIDITVPTTLGVVINPFQMEFETDELTDPDDASSAKVKSTEAVYSASQAIVNKSNVAVAVNVVDLKATPTDGITMATAAISNTVKTKSMYLSLDVTAPGSDKATSIAIPGVIEKDGKTTGKAASKDNMALLPALTAADADNPTDDELKASTAKFRISGSVVANPTETDTKTKVTTAKPWTADDKVDVSMKFTFTPQVKTNK